MDEGATSVRDTTELYQIDTFDRAPLARKSHLEKRASRK